MVSLKFKKDTDFLFFIVFKALIKITDIYLNKEILGRLDIEYELIERSASESRMNLSYFGSIEILSLMQIICTTFLFMLTLSV